MALFDLLNPYAYAMLIRRALYKRGVLRSHHPGIPVISVGNLSIGGTGKSPMVLHIARYLMEHHGKRVAIVMRGYRRKSRGLVVVRSGGAILANVDQTGDEAQMFAQLLPKAIVIVDEDRVRGAKRAKKLGVDVIILDDAYQHLRIQRDLNILLIDSSRSLSPVMPFGRFREPISAARAADILIFTHADDKDRLRANWNTLKPKLNENAIAASVHAVPSVLLSIGSDQQVDMSALNGKRVMALCSIAAPARFQQMLEGAGADVVVRSLGDHAEYSLALVQALLRDAERSGVETIVTTEKDAVKSREYFLEAPSAISVLVLSQKIEFLSGERSFYEAIDLIL
jgi:tetraacyldisaccharide 4'-kinase